MPRHSKSGNGSLLKGFARVARPEESGAGETMLGLFRKTHGLSAGTNVDTGEMNPAPPPIRRPPAGRRRRRAHRAPS